MIYPDAFEQKIGFCDVRAWLASLCLSAMGRDMAQAMAFLTDAAAVNERLLQTAEMRAIQNGDADLPLGALCDIRSFAKRLRVQGAYLDEAELFDMGRALTTADAVRRYVERGEPLPRHDDDGAEPAVRYHHPALRRLALGVADFAPLLRRLALLIDKYGHVRDDASPALLDIRRQKAAAESSVSRLLQQVLRAAQAAGVVAADAAPAMRDGRLVLPVAPGQKRRLRGIVHDESATGRTVYVEPQEVIEANNRIRELEGEERREVLRLLVAFAAELRPWAPDMARAAEFLAEMDFTQARARMAEQMRAIEPRVHAASKADWRGAAHPLLQRTLAKQGKQAVPLDIVLTPEKRLLIISGPNAGGKSVCLKTVGLLQYMVQCGLSVPLGERSEVGMFQHVMIDLGDEQSIENDLSTYSSHLRNMREMIRHADSATLLLIDELGTGTEPQIGAAIAEAVLQRLYEAGAWGVVTTHYQNLKHFADTRPGVQNGAMMYDREKMLPLFRLAIGMPGSSFAIDIARKTGLPQDVIQHAKDIVGEDYIQSDKYLQDILRDRRYWQNKRDAVHQREKELEAAMGRYEADLAAVAATRREILEKARAEAKTLLDEANRRVENLIREIREQQAEKEGTKRLREEFNLYKETALDTAADDEAIARKMEQIQRRRDRHAQHKADKAQRKAAAASALTAGTAEQEPPRPGDLVRIAGLESIGRLESVKGKEAVVAVGGARMKVAANKVARAPKAAVEAARKDTETAASRITRDTIDEHRQNLHPDLDVRGMRADEAIAAVQYFIDDAILASMQRVRILHGKGNGILRQQIRQYLATVPAVDRYADEHVQFGGAGITVVELG